MPNFIIFLGVLIFIIGLFIIIYLYSSNNSGLFHSQNQKVISVTSNETPPVVPILPDIDSETILKSEPVNGVINVVPPHKEETTLEEKTISYPNLTEVIYTETNEEKPSVTKKKKYYSNQKMKKNI